MTQTAVQRRFVRLSSSMNSKAARLGREGRITPLDLAAIYMSSEGVCVYCNVGIVPTDCSFDHVIPFDAGGLNIADNLRACCLTCQRQKARRLAHEFAEARALVRTCPIDGTRFRPRYADVRRGFGIYCSRSCAGKAGRLVRSGLLAS